MSGLLLPTVTAAAITVAVLCLNAVIPIAAATAVTLCVGRLARRRIGGVTGDVLGAGVELTETAVFLCAVASTGGAS